MLLFIVPRAVSLLCLHVPPAPPSHLWPFQAGERLLGCLALHPARAEEGLSCVNATAQQDRKKAKLTRRKRMVPALVSSESSWRWWRATSPALAWEGWREKGQAPHPRTNAKSNFYS